MSVYIYFNVAWTHHIIQVTHRAIFKKPKIVMKTSQYLSSHFPETGQCRFPQMERRLRYLVRGLRMPWKIGARDSRRKNRLAKLPRRATNRGKKPRARLPPHAHRQRRIRKFLPRGKFWIFNTRRRTSGIAELDGRLRAQFHFSYFLLLSAACYSG